MQDRCLLLAPPSCGSARHFRRCSARCPRPARKFTTSVGGNSASVCDRPAAAMLSPGHGAISSASGGFQLVTQCLRDDGCGNVHGAGGIGIQPSTAGATPLGSLHAVCPPAGSVRRTSPPRPPACRRTRPCVCHRGRTLGVLPAPIALLPVATEAGLASGSGLGTCSSHSSTTRSVARIGAQQRFRRDVGTHARQTTRAGEQLQKNAV